VNGGRSPAYSRIFLVLGAVVVAVWVFQLLRLILRVGGDYSGAIVAGVCVVVVAAVLVAVAVQRRRRERSGTPRRMS
jgi:hypothetical protein